MTHHEPMVHRDGDHFWLTCCDWRHDPASNDPDDGIRWGEWQAAIEAHVASTDPEDEVRHCPDCGAECDMRIGHCECGPDCPLPPVDR